MPPSSSYMPPSSSSIPPSSSYMPSVSTTTSTRYTIYVEPSSSKPYQPVSMPTSSYMPSPSSYMPPSSSYMPPPSSIRPSSVMPTPSYSTPVVTTSVPPSCPACYHKGAYYQPGETWTDKSKCMNMSCVEVVNPCAPLNKSVQINVNTPVCQACPKGYKTVQNNNKCCPECIPTENIPNVCTLVKKNSQKIKGKLKGVMCESKKVLPATACSGHCSSNMDNVFGDEPSSCNCCKPKSFTKLNITVKCEDNTERKTTYNLVKSCECQAQKCQPQMSSDAEMKKANNKRSVHKRSIYDQLDEFDIENNDKSMHRRKRRALLDDLANMQIKRNKK